MTSSLFPSPLVSYLDTFVVGSGVSDGVRHVGVGDGVRHVGVGDGVRDAVVGRVGIGVGVGPLGSV